MAKWKNPYVIRVRHGKNRTYFELMALTYGPVRVGLTEKDIIYRKHYEFMDIYPTLEKALKAKRKAYERSLK